MTITRISSNINIMGLHRAPKIQALKLSIILLSVMSHFGVMLKNARDHLLGPISSASAADPCVILSINATLLENSCSYDMRVHTQNCILSASALYFFDQLL